MQDSKCKVNKENFSQTLLGGNQIAKWWPNQLNLKLLQQNNEKINPNDRDFSYKKAFLSLDLKAVKKDLEKLMKESQEWWPADWGHYGPFFIRMAWHSAGTYRISDGRGGASSGGQRFAPLNSWPDNANLDKARRLLWPIKKKYGNKISWADLMILAGNVALESMGFKTYGFGGGRVDTYEPLEDINWGPEAEWLADERRREDKQLENPLAAVQMGLIYVNPEGPDGVPDALEAAKDIRMSFGRMGMNDEETVALIAGGHSFGKCHGAADPSKYLGPEPEAAPIEEQGLGWKNSYKSGKGADTITSGLEGAWTPTPTKWDNSFFEMLFEYDWNLEKSPAGAYQWVPTDPKTKELVPDAHIEGKSSKPIMLTTDLALRMDPKYKEISKRFYKNPKEFADAFAKAWFKLTHRDMGPKSRYLGEEVPKEDFIWQDPIPKIDYELVNSEDVAYLKKQILTSGLSVEELVYTAWRSAATYRDSDKRGGADGARIRLMPQCEWEVNKPEQLKRVLNRLEEIKEEFNQKGERKISLADMIVLAGNCAIEKAAKLAGFDVDVEFIPGRADAREEDTDIRSFEYLKPVGDGFVNYKQKDCDVPAPMLLIDMAVQLKLSVPQMSVLIGGLRSLGVSFEKNLGILTSESGVLNNQFFVNLLDMSIAWERDEANDERFIGRDRESGDIKYHATSVDLIFGSNSQLRAQAEFYAQDDNQEKFVRDFVKTWQKVMRLDRFDLHD